MKNRIRVLRAERRLTQKELGELVGVSREAINAIENNKHDPSLRLANQIARALQTTIAETFDLESEPLS